RTERWPPPSLAARLSRRIRMSAPPKTPPRRPPMTKVSAIWRRELRSYWNSPTAYILIVVFLVVLTWLHFRVFCVQNNAELGQFFGWLPAAFVFMLPALTMRQW